MCIATRCTSIDQFVAMFHRFVDEDSFFVSTVNTRPPGLETSFSVQLADGTPVLRGICKVLQVWTTAQSPFKTPGVRLGIKRLTANSMPVFERLLVTRSAPQATPPAPTAALAAGTTVPRIPAVTETTAVIEAPKFAETGPTKIVPRTSDTPAAADPPEAVDLRTPGSELILPANPLQNLSDASLEGYVDCTLYEETATFFAVDDSGTPIDDLVPPPAPPTFAPRPVGRLSTPVEIVQEPTDEPTFETTLAPPRRIAPTPPPMPVVSAPRSDATPLPVTAAPRADATPPPMPAADATPMPAILGAREPLPPPRESTPSGEIVSVMPVPSRRRSVVVAAGAVALVGALALWISMRGGSDPEAAPATKPVPAAQPAPIAPAPVAVVEPPPPPVSPVPPEEEVAPPSEPESTAPMAGEGPCQLAVASTPAGSIVHLDGKAIAPSPITIATSCERHKVDIKHPRYKLATKFVALKEGAPGAVDVTLQRPTHSVRVTSQPSGATIFIDGHRAGTTPTVLSVLGFSNLKLEVKKTGYATISRKLYSKTAQDKVAVKLTKW
jgi:hypothetical protein